MSKTLILFLFVLSFNSICFSQFPELEQQTKIIEDEIIQVLGLTQNNPDGNQIGFNLSLARNYYRLDNYKKAEHYYLKVIDQNICSPLDYKALAICLTHNGKMSLAEEFFRTYSSDNQETAFDKLWNTSDKPQSKYTRIRSEKLTNFDFLYGSLNTDGSTYLNIDHGTVRANVGCQSLVNMTAITWPTGEFDRIGSFTNGALPNSYFYSYKNDEGHYCIYYVYQKKGKWSKPKRLELGEPGANYVFPFFHEGKLYFSSDKSGGKGQFDLYEAGWDGKGAENVHNLGAFINTDKNEILPSLVNGRLSFASNGLPGGGGYDIFYTDWTYKTINTEEYPYNSNHHDFQLLDSREESAAIIRQEGGKTNVYLVEKYWDYNRVLTGTVIDNRGNDVPETRVLIAQQGATVGKFAITDLDGKFSIQLPDTIDDWVVEVNKPNYNPEKFVLSLSTLGDNPLSISLTHSTPIEPEPVFIINSPSQNVIPSAPGSDSTRQDAPTDSSSQQSDSTDDLFSEVDHDGVYYIIYASSRSYKGAYTFWEEWVKSFPDAEILKNEEKGVYRVGTYAGTTQTEAMKAYTRAKHIKSDAWILRPNQL